MKKVLFTIIAIVAIGSFTSNAQGLKFGHVYTQSVIDSVKSYQNLLAEQERLSKKYNKNLESLNKQLMEKETEIYAAADTADDLEIELLQRDYRGIQEKMQLVEMDNRKNLNALQERIGDLFDLYKEAVETIANKHNITYVLDADSQVLYAGPKGQDLTAEVRTELIKMDTENPVYPYGTP